MSDLKTYTWLEVTEHMTEESCWLVIDGKVFDVTKYLDDHPGSRKPLLKYAGTHYFFFNFLITIQKSFRKKN